MSDDSIIEWYAGRTLFVTGGTGFMGKVLLEKLLRSCPDVKRIYVLCRGKKGFSPNARIEEMSKLPLFDKVRKMNPSFYKKMVAVDGDIMRKDLGIQSDMKERLINEVSVVINGAASLRLEASLKPAVLHNTVGTQRILELSCQMKHLKAFVHLSTAFCHCEYEKLEETVYPTPISPTDVIQTVQWMDETALEMITPRILGPHPNCYTFSKRLSESLVSEYASRIPVAIARPSIVIPSLKEPMPGWVDNLNGPVGITIAAGKGILRSMMVVKEFNAEVVPVDIAINTIIAIAWERGRTPKENDETVPVYNVTNGDIKTMTWEEIFEKGKKIGYEYPFDAGLWYPNGTMRINPITHFLAVLFLQIIPAYFIDGLLFLAGQKTFMVRVQKRIYVGLQVLQYFTTRQWIFANENVRKLCGKINSKERPIFYIDNVEVNVEEFMKDIILGARQYVMKEPLSTLPKARIMQRIQFYVDLLVQTLLYGMLIWYVTKLLNLHGPISSLIPSSS